jgi:hypothetical protein
MQRMEVMPHMHYQYAGLWWLTQSLRSTPAVLTDNIEEACLVWVDSYCYNQARGTGRHFHKSNGWCKHWI